MNKNYTNEVDVQIVIALLKAHNIKKIVISPGSTNHSFVLSIQNDYFFELYSCVDERSAAYMACGLSAESGEPVVLSCTAATASRNYFPALTEAFYRKLPILALTSTRTVCQVGQLIDQQIDRSVQPKDTVKISVNLPYVKDAEDFWECEFLVNKAILELDHHGKGPVHINMPTRYDHGYDCKELPNVRKISRFIMGDSLPELPKNKRIGIYIGAHHIFSEEEINIIDRFCECNNAVVFTEHTSGYKGKYGINFYQAFVQKKALFPYYPDLIIDMGEIASLCRMSGKEFWRLSEDGIPRDIWKKLTNVFEMKDKDFFQYYIKEELPKNLSYYNEVKEYCKKIMDIKVDLPFSNVYAAHKLSVAIPKNSVIHFGILNSLRSWTLFNLDKTINCYSNTGGYGIDGGVSTLIGASLIHPEKLYFGVFGDLCFFYDMNSLGNRDIGKNLRILMVNNGLGEEFKTFFSHTYSWGDDINRFVAAEGHFGKKSPFLVKHYVEDLGFEYLNASNKEEFEAQYEKFVNADYTERPIFFELFTNDFDENCALEKIMTKYETSIGTAKNIAKNLLGEKGTQALKKMLGK